MSSTGEVSHAHIVIPWTGRIVQASRPAGASADSMLAGGLVSWVANCACIMCGVPGLFFGRSSTALWLGMQAVIAGGEGFEAEKQAEGSCRPRKSTREEPAGPWRTYDRTPQPLSSCAASRAIFVLFVSLFTLVHCSTCT